MLVSSTSINAASETATAMVQGLPLGCQISPPKLAAVPLIGPYIGFNEQVRNEFDELALVVGFQFVEGMLDVTNSRHELRAFLRHCSQKSLPSLVDESDGTEIERAGASVLGAVPVFPACSELGDSRHDQATLERPLLFGGCFRNRHSQNLSAPSIE